MLSSGRSEGGGLARPLGAPLGPPLYNHHHRHNHHVPQAPLCDSSDDEYGSCTEAPLYENLEDVDDDHDDDGGGVYENVVVVPGSSQSQEVYENVVFELPAYTNLLPPPCARRDEDLLAGDDPQVYANLPALDEAPTYDVPQRKQQPVVQEYANLQPPVVQGPQAPSAGCGGSAGLGVIVEESETSSARSSGSSAAESTPTSAASSLGRGVGGGGRGGGGGAATLVATLRPLSNGVSQGSPAGKSHPLVVSLTPKADLLQSGDPQVAEQQLRRQVQLARVQQQVQQHLQEERPPEQQKRSVRDLLGHFEAQGSGVANKFTVRKTLSQPAGYANGGSSSCSSSASNSSRTSFLQSLTAASSHSNAASLSESPAGPTHRRWSSGSNGLHSNASAKDVGSVEPTKERVTFGASDRLGSGASNKDSTKDWVRDRGTYGLKAWGNHDLSRDRGNSLNGDNSRVSNISSSSDGGNRRTSANGEDLKQRSAVHSHARRSVSYNMECIKNEVNRVDVKLNGLNKPDEMSKTASNGGVNGSAAAAGSATGSVVLTGGANGASVGAVNKGVNGGVSAGASESRVAAVDTRQPRDEDIPSIVASLPDDDRVIAEARRTTSSWDPSVLVTSLYVVPEPLRDKPRPKDRVNIEGFLERLPSGRTKATFWNAWKRCYFRAKDGFLYCYASKHSDKPMAVTQLMGGTLETFESMIITAQDRNPAMVPMIGIDDRMGHYLVVRASTPQETERWTLALRTHTVEDFCSTYVQPWPLPRAPALLRDSIVIDLGSCSVRAGVLCTQPSLPQLFFPAVCATRRAARGGLRGLERGPERVYGSQALQPKVRANSVLSYPIRPSDKINKHSVDLAAVSGLVGVVLQWLAVDPRDYGLVLSVPRALDAATQARLVADLFDKHGLRSVVLSHQSVLALYAYNASSGVVVDIGERTDVVPIMDGYIVEGGVSRVPYGGEQVVGHVRRFLLQRAPPLSLSTVPEALLPRLALEKICFVSSDYRADLKRSLRDPGEMAASVSVREFFAGANDPAMESLTLDTGRFQAPEGLFHPQAWGLDIQGVHKMVHKAIQECSMDARKTMARSVFLAGGLTMMPGFPERLRDELTALLPAAVSPKVHASPYRYHAAYIGACALANSSGVEEMRLTRDEWTRDGGRLLQPWIL